MIRVLVEAHTLVMDPAWLEQRCPCCHRLLFKGRLVGEIKCGRCGNLLRFSEDRGVG